MIKTGIVVLFAALTLVAGPGREASSEVIHSVTLQEILSLGTLDDGALVQWTGIAVDAAGRIYVLDVLDYSLKKFDSRGGLLKKTGRKGQGPGEFLAPRVLAISGGRIFALDQSRSGILVFDLDLSFRSMIPVSRPLSMLTALGTGRLAVSGLTPIGEPARISIMDVEGKVLSEFSFLDKVEFYLADSITSAADAEGNLYLAYFFLDRIEKRNGQGKVVWTWSLAGPGPVPTERLTAGGREFMIPKNTFYKSAALDRQGHLLVLCGGQTKHPSRDVSVFSPSGDRLAVFALPEPSHCIYVDDNGFLYSRANEGLTVKKYRIVYR